MKILTRTAYGALLQAAQLGQRPFVLVPNTTLNEKFNVQSGVIPAPNTLPAVGYYCIGNGGHANKTGTDGFPYTTPLQHDPTDAALFKHLPFIVRPVGSDLDPATRAKYALRTQITGKDGQPYVAYYLKRLNLTGVQPALQKSTTVNGVTSVQPYVPTSANLNPTPHTPSSTGVVTTDGSYITASMTIPVVFDPNDVVELINVAQVLFGNEHYAVVSEIGLCSGQDKMVTVAASGGNLTYNEAVAVQIVTHVTANYQVGSSNQGIDIEIETGATEPLFGATDVSTSLYTPAAA